MNENGERLVLSSEREGAEKRERKPWQRRKERQKERERSVSWSVGGSRSVAATPRTLKSTSFQYPILTCFISVMEIPLSLPQIFRKVSYTHKCPGEVVLWKLNKRVAVGTVGPEGDLESEVRRRKISPSRVTKLLLRLWTIPVWNEIWFYLGLISQKDSCKSPALKWISKLGLCTCRESPV